MRLRGRQLTPHARRRVAAVTCLLQLASSLSLAQETGRLIGAVRDETGGALSGARVTVTDDCARTPRTVITDAISVLPAMTLDHMGIRAIEGLAGMAPAAYIP
jgi:hypothetical protein